MTDIPPFTFSYVTMVQFYDVIQQVRIHQTRRSFMTAETPLPSFLTVFSTWQVLGPSILLE